ncbi:MAG: hypothetical protein ACREO4_09245 [Lysobacter sp.]
MRHTNGEIQEAKMLARKVAALKNVSAPPLSRLRGALVLFVRACWNVVRGVVRRTWWKLRDRTLCPHCFGHMQKLTHVVHDEFEMKPCKLCRGRGHIGWQEREAVKWGRALFDYRMQRRHSLAFMQSAIGTPEHIIYKCENGLIHLDDWPYPLYNIAEVHLGRTSNT